MKLFRWIDDNILLLISLFFLAFIPLYPKLPIVGVSHVLVYIRIEDFLVAFAVTIYFIQLLREKVEYRSVLTIPIFIFWGIGLISTVYGLIYVFPHLQDPNITNHPEIYIRNAMLFYVRHIEYLSLFFIAYAAIRQKKQLNIVVLVSTITLFLIVGYGIGQRVIPQNFPAFSTMNEEFAKGIPLQLSSAGRVQATFAGHYDLAAYLVLIIPIIASMIFGFKKWWIKLLLFLSAYGGLILLLLTASRVSFAMYLLSVCFMLILQKQKKFIIPVLAASILTLSMFQGISDRYLGTVSQVDLITDARTGRTVGIAKTSEQKKATIEDSQSTGENLPQGSSYISLPGNSDANLNEIIYKRLIPQDGSEIQEVTSIHGNFVIKKAFAYDVSFTTRFQGEWPRALEALKRNYFLGSGYSSISTATDNNYLRMLGETGVLGLFSFLFIFVVLGIYAKKILPNIESGGLRSFIVGTLAGVFGLGLNAILIDVFEASKVAFILWTIVGITVGLLHLYQEGKLDYLYELKKFFGSRYVQISILLFSTFVIFSSVTSNFFVGDDFIWLRSAADCMRIDVTCKPAFQTITGYFTDSHNFFYRPGVETYFYLMYGLFGLKPLAYHIVSILVHFLITTILFLLAKRIIKNQALSFAASFLFLVLSVHFETIAWVSTINHLLASLGIVLSLYLFVLWTETKRIYLLILSLIFSVSGIFFHELAIVAPLMVIAYDLVNNEKKALKGILLRWYYYLFFGVIAIDLYLRIYAKSVWALADYRYNIEKLPLNVVGNAIGYIFLTFFGTSTLPFYDLLRNSLKNNLLLVGFILILMLICLYIIVRAGIRLVKKEGRRILLFSGVFFVIPLLPFLGLGNISTRYDYLASFGLLILAVYGLHTFVNTVLKASKDKFRITVITIILSAFGLVQMHQIGQLNKDWNTAGTITYNLLRDVNSAYAGSQIILPDSTFFFVNTPIRYGQAWVFPVGLEDALWFTFQDLNLQIVQEKSAEEALTKSETIPGSKVFQFQVDGAIVEVLKVSPTPASLILKPS